MQIVDRGWEGNSTPRDLKDITAAFTRLAKLVAVGHAHIVETCHIRQEFDFLLMRNVFSIMAEE